MPRWLVLLNAEAGTIQRSDDPDLAGRIGRLFQDNGVDADVRAVPPDRIVPLVRDAAVGGGYDAVVAGGGDGTINSIATELLDKPPAFGVLPLGTFNHFAKELGYSTDLDDAVPALARGEARHLPIGEVNGRIFLNFSGIGLHPRMVSERERARDPRGSKMLATLVAAVRAVFRLPVQFVRLTLPDRSVRRVTPSVIVCNNRHQMRAFGVEAASETDRRRLNVYVARTTKPLGVIWLLVRALLRMLRPSDSFEVIAAPEVTVRMARPAVTVSIDGELVRMRTPLRYRVRERSLRVIVPATT